MSPMPAPFKSAAVIAREVRMELKSAFPGASIAVSGTKTEILLYWKKSAVDLLAVKSVVSRWQDDPANTKCWTLLAV